MQYTYGAIFLASPVLLPLYFLFVCVSIVNLGYTLVAFSKTVEFALFANKITYLG